MKVRGKHCISVHLPKAKHRKEKGKQKIAKRYWVSAVARNNEEANTLKRARSDRLRTEPTVLIQRRDEGRKKQLTSSFLA